jgi:hypothetical protein
METVSNYTSQDYQSRQNLLSSCLLSKHLKIKLYKTIILLLFWDSLTVFENRVLRRTYGPNREEVAQGCRTLHNEKLCNLYASPNRVIKSRMMRWAGHVTHKRQIKNGDKILVRKNERKRPLRSLRQI